MLRQLGIGARHGRANLRRRIARDDCRGRLGIAIARQRHYRAIAHLRLAPQGRFQIFRINV